MCESLIGSHVGPYQLLELIGQGGMATVYRAHQKSVDRQVAVKLIHKRHAHDPASSERFQREARLIARLEHPHILPVYDFDGSHDPPYIVMRYLAGGTLKELGTNSPQPLAPETLLAILSDIASALDYAHRQGIIHRDLKPSNIMIDDDLNGFLTDFGIARMLVDEEVALTQHGVLVGTPEYMAPEQAMAESQLGPAADLYALAVVLYELVSGQLPFSAPTPISQALMHVTKNPPPVTSLRDGLPTELDEVMTRALAKKPDERFDSARDLISAAARAFGLTARNLSDATTPEPAQSPDSDTSDPGPASHETLSERNKMVTILHLTAAEYVELVDDNEGPETARSAIRSIMSEFEKVITTSGGRIVDSTEAALTALWGAGITRENDAEQAVKTALAVRRQFVAATGLDNDIDDPLPLRLGVHTGLVLLSPQIDAQGEVVYSASGATMSIATRLTEQAEGSLLIAHDTFRLVRGVFNITPAGSIRVFHRSSRRGSARLEIYEVIEAKQRAFRMKARGIGKVETAMIGRDRELEILQEAFLSVTEDHEAQAVSLLGGAGIGKSRLVEEFETWIDLRPERCAVFRGRAEHSSDPAPFSLIHNLLSFRFEILDDDEPETALTKTAQGMADLLDRHTADDEMVHLVGHLAGFDLGESSYVDGLAGDPEQLAQRSHQLFVRFFRNIARIRPILLTLEDVHSADDASLDLLLEVARENHDSSLLFVFLARPDLILRRHNWGHELANHRRLSLEGLDKRQSRALVAEILQKVESIPDSLRDLLVERAEGNPLFMEELVKMMIEDRIISEESDGEWRVEETRIDQQRVPPTLTSLLQARLDTLLAPERIVLQRAAIMGRLFTDIAIEALDFADQEGLSADDLDGILEQLVERGFLFACETSSFEGGRDYGFAQSMMRDLIYESMLRRQRRSYHAALARWMVSIHRVAENPVAIAEHFEEAGLTADAIGYFQSAGDRARQIGAYREAQALYEHALDLIENPGAAGNTPLPDATTETGLVSPPETQITLRLVLGEVLRLRGRFEEASKQLTTALEEAECAHDELARAAALFELSQVASSLGDYAKAQDLLDTCLPLANESGDQTILAQVYYGCGDLLWRRGEYSDAILPLETSLQHARDDDDPNAILFALNRLGSVRMFQKRYDEARSIYDEGRQIASRTGNRERLVAFLNNLGEIERLEGNFGAARDYYLDTLEIIRETGRRNAESVVLGNLGATALELGETAEAEEYARASLASARDIGMTRMVVGGLILFAKLAARAGNTSRALELLGLVTNHPAADADLREYAAPAIAEIATELTVTEVDQGLARGRTLNLEEVVGTLV